MINYIFLPACGISSSDYTVVLLIRGNSPCHAASMAERDELLAVQTLSGDVEYL